MIGYAVLFIHAYKIKHNTFTESDFPVTKQITIELQESLYKTLVFVSKSMDEPIEKLIVDGLYNHVAGIEDKISAAFGNGHAPQEH